MSWWQDRLAEDREPKASPAPQIPQTVAPDTTVAGLVEQAKQNMSQVQPAATVAERFGQAPGGDIGTAPRRHAPAAERGPSLLALTPQQQAEVVRLGTEAGVFGPASERGRGAQDHAALVADLLKSGAYTTSTDGTPGHRYEDCWPYGRQRPVTAVSERPVKAASKFWNATPIPHAREPEWQSGVPDTSKAVTCSECGRRWLTADHLSMHVELVHTPKLPQAARGRVTRGAMDAITSWIADGTLKPGDPVRQNEMAAEMGVSSASMSVAVGQLVAEGVLVYEGAGFQRRAHVPSRNAP